MSSPPEAARAARQPRISVYPDGPMLIRGDIPLVDEDGNEIWARRKVVALCRCGRSRLAPLCDGSHQRKGRQPAS
jgi:CDGSH-type Zn-finger protein